MKRVVLIAAAALCGCADTYYYVPESANVTSGDVPASRTQIPQEAPQGAVEVASYGVTRIRVGESNIPALHVRMEVTNDGDQVPWQLDTREQYVEIKGHGRTRAMYVNASEQTLPIVSIPQRGKRTFDFFFPLPPGVHDAGHLPQFDMLWQVTTDQRTIASRTEFQRMTPVYAYDPWPYYGAGYWGWSGYPYWWYDPWYPHVTPVRVDHFHGTYSPGGPVAHGGYHQ